MTCVLYRGFPSKLHHEVPDWVEPGALFHIRIAANREKQKVPLTFAPLAEALLDSAKFYQARQRWHITLFLLMPFACALIICMRSINEPHHRRMETFQARKHGVVWQEGYFDHRLRDDERGEQFTAKMDYIRQNPVAAGLCANADDWRWIIASAGSSAPSLDGKNNAPSAPN